MQIALSEADLFVIFHLACDVAVINMQVTLLLWNLKAFNSFCQC